MLLYGPLQKKTYVIHKTGSTQRITMTPEEDRATANCNMHKNLAKIGYVVLKIYSWTYRHTHKQTYTDVLITILCNRSSRRSKNPLKSQLQQLSLGPSLSLYKGKSEKTSVTLCTLTIEGLLIQHVVRLSGASKQFHPA